MFVACWIWCLADVSSISPSSEQIIITRRADSLLSTDPMADYLFSGHYTVISDLITDQVTISHC